MAYGVSLTEEAKKVVMKSTQKNLRGGEVEDKSDKCYFCGNVVPKGFADLARENLEEVVCESCIFKLVKLLAKQGVRRLE